MTVLLILVLVGQGILAVWLARLAARISRLEWDRFGSLAKYSKQLRKWETK